MIKFIKTNKLLIVLLVVFFSLLTVYLFMNSSTNVIVTKNNSEKSALEKIFITINKEDFDNMMKNPKEKEYKKASVEIAGVKYEDVAIKTKGNSTIDGVKKINGNKYGLKINFSKYNDNNKDLSDLHLNNGFYDETQMKEYISYELMRNFGMNVPETEYFEVYVNNKYYGLMLGIEEIDKEFIKKTYGNKDGFLFKPEGEGADLTYRSDDLNDYPGILKEVKMNDEKVSESKIIQMIKEINKGNVDSLNVGQIARYFAVNSALVNLDSYLGNEKQNYFLYEDVSGKFNILPWDYNLSFGGMRLQSVEGVEKPALNYDVNLMSEYLDYEAVSQVDLENSPLFKAIIENEEGKKLYNQYLNDFVNEIMTEENLYSVSLELVKKLKHSLKHDKNYFYSLDNFYKAPMKFKEFAKMRKINIVE